MTEPVGWIGAESAGRVAGGSRACHFLAISGDYARAVEWDVLWIAGMLLGAAAMLTWWLLATWPPRCQACGLPATDVEEEERTVPGGMLEVSYRCPACGDLVGRRLIGIPDP